MKSLYSSRPWIPLLAWLLLGLSTPLAVAADLNLYVQPIESVTETEQAFKPLADYLGVKIGRPVHIRTEASFLAYWTRMNSGEEFHLVLDAAHFTDYRIKQQGYQVLAKVPDTVSFSLVTRQDLLLLDAQELLGQPVATAASPSLGGVRMEELFPNPMRQPILMQTDNFQLALDKLRNGEVKAALVPTPMVSNDSTVNTILTTRPVPHMALSASPALDANTRQTIRRALLEAATDPKGQAMLRALNFTHFEPATNAVYNGYAELLSGVWGYKGR